MTASAATARPGTPGWRVRAGIALFALAGPLSLGGLLLRGPIVDQSVDPARWAAVASSSSFVAAWYLLLPSLVVQMLGFAALARFTENGPAGRAGFWGFVLGVLGNGLWLPSAGVLALASPSLAALHLAGDPGAVGVLNAALFGPAALPAMAVSAVGLLGGSLAFAWAIWRTPGLPRWAALPYALHALCLTFLAPLSYAVELTGGALLLVSSAAVALAVWRRSAP